MKDNGDPGRRGTVSGVTMETVAGWGLELTSKGAGEKQIEKSNR
jgi:hypothetical protein